MSRMTVEISGAFEAELGRFAARNGISTAEAVRRALAVIALAEREQRKGRSLGIVEEDKTSRELRAVGRIRGL